MLLSTLLSTVLVFAVSSNGQNKLITGPITSVRRPGMLPSIGESNPSTTGMDISGNSLSTYSAIPNHSLLREQPTHQTRDISSIGIDFSKAEQQSKMAKLLQQKQQNNYNIKMMRNKFKEVRDQDLKKGKEQYLHECDIKIARINGEVGRNPGICRTIPLGGRYQVAGKVFETVVKKGCLEYYCWSRAHEQKENKRLASIQ